MPPGLVCSWTDRRARAVSSVVRALASHARGPRFKSSTAHHRPELPGSCRDSAEVAERQTRYVQDVVPLRVCGFKSLLRHHLSKPSLALGRPSEFAENTRANPLTAHMRSAILFADSPSGSRALRPPASKAQQRALHPHASGGRSPSPIPRASFSFLRCAQIWLRRACGRVAKRTPRRAAIPSCRTRAPAWPT